MSTVTITIKSEKPANIVLTERRPEEKLKNDKLSKKILKDIFEFISKK